MNYGHVVLADMHLELLREMGDMLEGTFETVSKVRDRHSLFEAAEKTTIDLAVADLSLPNSASINLVREFKERFPGIKLIILSIHDEPAVIREVVAAGADGFVLKRSLASDLIPAVHAVIEGASYKSPILEKDTGHGRHPPPTGEPSKEKPMNVEWPEQ